MTDYADDDRADPRPRGAGCCYSTSEQRLATPCVICDTDIWIGRPDCWIQQRRRCRSILKVLLNQLDRETLTAAGAVYRLL